MLSVEAFIGVIAKVLMVVNTCSVVELSRQSFI